MDDEMGKDLVVRNLRGFPSGASIVKGQENADGQEREGDGNVRESAQDQGETGFRGVGRCQETLHHVLIGAVRGHRKECGTYHRGKNRVGLRKHFPECLPEGKGPVPADLNPAQMLPSSEGIPGRGDSPKAVH